MLKFIFNHLETHYNLLDNISGFFFFFFFFFFEEEEDGNSYTVKRTVVLERNQSEDVYGIIPYVSRPRIYCKFSEKFLFFIFSKCVLKASTYLLFLQTNNPFHIFI